MFGPRFLVHPEHGESKQPVGPQDWSGWLKLGWEFIPGEEPTPAPPVDDDPVRTPAKGAELSAPRYLVKGKEVSKQPVYPSDFAGWFKLGWSLKEGDRTTIEAESTPTPSPIAPTPVEPAPSTANKSDVGIYIDELQAIQEASGWSALKKQAEDLGFVKDPDKSWEESIPAIAEMMAES